MSVSIYFIVTKKCNYSCSFCIRDNISIPQRDVQFDDFVTIIEKCSKSFKEYNLIITGGEPFLHPKFFEMLDYASRKLKSITVTSNGSFSQKDANQLKNFLIRGNVFLQLSIDGDKLLHDSVRGNGAYDSVIRNLFDLQEFFKRIVISTTVVKDGYIGVLELAKQLNNCKFLHWKVSPVQLSNPRELENEIDPAVWNKFVDKLLPLCKFRVHVKKFFDFNLMDRYKHSEVFSHSIRNCGFGINKFYISSDFNVFPCSCITDPIGNIMNEDIEILYPRLVEIGTIVPKEGSICSRCEYVKICNGGCPGYSKKCFGEYNLGDIRCPKIRSFYEKYKSINNQ